MLGRTNTGGGGGVGGLNFQIVGSTNAPGNPKENMIWVNTDKDITSWIFSATQPTDPTEGMVWISTGTFSTVEFNALKKHGIQVYPILARQYLSGAFADKSAKIYQNSQWNDFWAGDLYTPGDEWVNITGGWETVGMKRIASDDANPRALTVTKTNEFIKFEQTSAQYHGIAYTKNKIDATGYKTLKITGIFYCPDAANLWRFSVKLWSDIGTYAEDNSIGGWGLDQKTSAVRTISIDISSIAGKTPFHIGCSIRNGGCYMQINKMWLE